MGKILLITTDKEASEQLAKLWVYLRTKLKTPQERHDLDIACDELRLIIEPTEG